MTAALPEVAVIVVSFNTRGLLQECLAALQVARGRERCEIIVIDNASSDRSAEMVRDVFPEVTLVRNAGNAGFAVANNQALALTRARDILLLNSDAVVMPSAIVNLEAELRQHDRLGIVGPTLRNSDGSLQPSWGSFPTPADEFAFQTFLFKLWPSRFPYGRRVHPWRRAAYRRFQWVDWVTGAALMLRREVYERIGGLPEETFMYAEDMEYCWRARQAGYRVAYCPSAVVYHRMQGSARQNYARWIENYTQSILAFHGRHSSRRDRRQIAFMTWGGNLLRIAVWRAVATLLPARRAEARSRVAGYACAAGLAREALRRG
jgi:GT2 family glycosyltransferase